jgi:hypothetical protein
VRGRLLLTLPLLALTIAACGVSPATTPTPVATPTPAPVTEQQSIEMALPFLQSNNPGIYRIENPRDPVAALMTRGELNALFGSETRPPQDPTNCFGSSK